ncbi:hypothetical protein C2G38_2128994 [Gigaspora rosea]|uniref:Zn(2)-C6 fungal-type domain-containing protein n=1 Tax=Gigaspora rosea TaxID=44941 RepID=A0A397TWR4_9GLOM|nr:hypothetical protein C2G38_2128994 [Gigaspora rosea]CAG8645065.1 10133_t:CDS:1 [Gigaspora rosea]
MPLQRQKRGPYVTKACANCQKKHKKCSGKATCNYCKLHNIMCIFVKSDKKRGPKMNRKPLEQSHIFNYTGFNFDETSMQFSTIPNLAQSRTLNLFGYQFNASQQRLDNNHAITFNSSSDEELQSIFISQEIGPFFYQTTYF